MSIKTALDTRIETSILILDDNKELNTAIKAAVKRGSYSCSVSPECLSDVKYRVALQNLGYSVASSGSSWIVYWS